MKIVIGVKDLDAAIAKYRQAYGLPAPVRQDDAEFGAKLASFAGTPVVLAAPLSPRSWLTPRLAQFGEAPCAFVLGKVGHPAGFGHISWLDSAHLGWRLGITGP